MSFFDIFKKKKTVDAEAERRARLMQFGRITEGTIIDNETNDAGREIAFYIYTVSGADFESSEILTEEQLREPVKYAPGAKVSIRFDRKNHGNSILV